MASQKGTDLDENEIDPDNEAASTAAEEAFFAEAHARARAGAPQAPSTFPTTPVDASQQARKVYPDRPSKTPGHGPGYGPDYERGLDSDH